MILALLIGAILFAIGVRLLRTVLLFYLGQRRDLYFHEARAWMGHARLGGALCIMGGGLFGVAGYGQELAASGIIFGSLAIAVVWWLTLPAIIRLLPPLWLKDFEVNHSREDIEAVIQNGQAMLFLYPKAFPQIIRDQVGWETWLLTVTGMVPMVNLELYRLRALQAMERKLYPIAIVAADNIIKYRPDQALGYKLRAQAYFYDFRYDKAITDYTIAIQLQPNDIDLYYYRARMLLIMDAPAAALEDINRALGIEPGHGRLLDLRKSAQERLASA